MAQNTKLLPARRSRGRLTIGVLGSVLALGLGCSDDPEGPTAFMTHGADEVGSETDALADVNLMEGNDAELSEGDGDSGDGDSGDGDSGDGDSGDGDGDGDGDTTTTDTGGACGNGVIDDGEQCDGGNLGGFSCADLGYSGGTLACDPVTCTYDASGCTTDTTTSSGGTSG